MTNYDERMEQFRNNAKDRAYRALSDMAQYENVLGPIMRKMDDESLKHMPSPDCVYWTDAYEYWDGTVEPARCEFEVYAPVNEDLPWRKRMQPMAAFFAVFGIKHRTRNVREYSGSVEYKGETTINGYAVRITYTCGKGGLAPSCKLVAEETEETIKRIRYSTVCD